MLASQSIPVFSQRQQAFIIGTGLTTVIAIGAAACIGLTLALVWLTVHIALIALQAILTVLAALGSTFTAASPLAQFLMIVAVAYVLYRVFRKSGGLHS
jgi:hypothetical protein